MRCQIWVTELDAGRAQTVLAVLSHAGRAPHEAHAAAQHARAGPGCLTALGPACAQAQRGTASRTQRQGTTPMPAVRQHWRHFARKSHCLWVVLPAQQQQVGWGPLCRLDVLLTIQRPGSMPSPGQYSTAATCDFRHSLPPGCRPLKGGSMSNMPLLCRQQSQSHPWGQAPSTAAGDAGGDLR